MMNRYTIYGIRNCDTMKKAFLWLEAHHVPLVFHDYKKEGIAKEKLAEWCRQKGLETLLNKKGSTWRQLDEARKAKIQGIKDAVMLMHEKTSLIKRPLIEDQNGEIIALGFDEAMYTSLFTKNP